MYSEAGKKATDRLWNETMAELEFVKPRDILASMAGQQLNKA